jgi:FkbM family methyltransferase
MLNKIVGSVGLWYALRMPGHRGKFRLLNMLDRLAGPFLLRCGSEGLLMETFLSSSMDVSYFVAEEGGADASIDREAMRYIKKLSPGDTYIDIGANTGFLAMNASRRVGRGGRVLAFEPSPREYTRLQGNGRRNQCSNLICVNIALGAKNSLVRFHVEPHHTGLNKLVPAEGGGHGEAPFVPVVAGSGILADWVGSRPALLKIDVEGAEMLVLAGIRDFLQTCPPRVVVIEITDRFLREFGSNKAEIYEFMSELGYCPEINSDDWQYDEVFVCEK